MESRFKWTSVIGLLFLSVGVATVFAHADLVKAKPAVGQTVTQPPTQIELTFSTLVASGTIELYDADLNLIPTTPQTAPDPLMLVTRIDKPLARGEYSVVWSATAVDGHTLSGSYNFAYQKPAPPITPFWSKLGFRLAMVGLGIILGLWFLRRR